MSNNSRKRKGGYPTVDQFHSILEKISPGKFFSKGAVEGFREVYLTYLAEVGSSLTQWDSLKEEEKIVEALSVNPMLGEFAAEAKILLSKSDTTDRKPAAKKRKKRKLTEADAAEQERLLAQSKKSLSKET